MWRYRGIKYHLNTVWKTFCSSRAILSFLLTLPLQRCQAPSRALVVLFYGVFWAISSKRGPEGPLLLGCDGWSVTHTFAVLPASLLWSNSWPWRAARHGLLLSCRKNRSCLCSWENSTSNGSKESSQERDKTKHYSAEFRDMGRFSAFNLRTSGEEQVSISGSSAGHPWSTWRSC